MFYVGYSVLQISRLNRLVFIFMNAKMSTETSLRSLLLFCA